MNVFSSPRTRPPLPVGSPDLSPPKSAAEKLGMLFGVSFPVVGLVATIVFAWGHTVGWFDLVLLVGGYAVTALGVTLGFHRMFTHRAFQGGPALRFLLAVAGSMACQGSVLEWCSVHREHHKHSDRDGDPHSPHLHDGGWLNAMRGFIHSHVSWLFTETRNAPVSSIADLIADPVLAFVDRFSLLWIGLGWIIPPILGALIFHTWTAALEAFLWGSLARTFMMHHITWSINSVCHVWGARRFETADYSRNNVVFGIIAFGEGWHNNHHAFPTSARHGLRWWQIDISYYLIRAMEAIGLVWNVRLPSAAAINARENASSTIAASPSVNPASMG